MRFQEIAAIEACACAVCICEVEFSQLAVPEGRFFEFYLIERRVIECALFERGRKGERAAMFEMQAEHLASGKGHTVEDRPRQAHHTEIANGERTIDKLEITQIGVGEIALYE